MDALSETAYDHESRSQAEEGRRRELFGPEDEVTSFTDSEGEVANGVPDSDLGRLWTGPYKDGIDYSQGGSDLHEFVLYRAPSSYSTFETALCAVLDCAARPSAPIHCVRTTAEYQGCNIEVVDPSAYDVGLIPLPEALRRLGARIDTETFEDVAMEVFDEAFDLMVARQRKYGPGNIETLGQYGVFTRMEDKMERIRRSFNGKIVNGKIELDEAVEHKDDTLDDADLDLMNYAAIRLIHRRGKWGKPLAEEVGAE